MIIGGMNQGIDVRRTNTLHPILSSRSHPISEAQPPPRVNAMLPCKKEKVGKISFEETFFAPNTPTVEEFSPHPRPMSALARSNV